MRGPDATSLRVLVVDDNVDTAMSLGFLLRSWGHEVQMAHDGPSAIDGVLEFQPAVILLDIGLPRMDGFEVAQHLRSLPDLGRPLIVASSGFNRERDRQRAAEVGIDLYLVKPFDLRRLEQILDTYQPAPRAVPA